MPIYLALQEIYYSKGRFLLISMVVALITTLVLFIAGLAEGLAAANKEYIEKLTGPLVVFQADVELSIPSSRIGRSRVNEIRRVEGVADVGQVGFATATLVFDRNAIGERAAAEQESLDVSLVGIEPGRPGDPVVREGNQLLLNRGDDIIIDRNVALRRGVELGDVITIKTVQGTRDEFYDLRVVGIADKLQYQFLPSIILPYETWEKVRPQAENSTATGELVSNIAVVRLSAGAEQAQMIERLERRVSDIEVVDRVTAYESSPGYAAQQSTLNTQRVFTLFIGVLVVGGFFWIQTLQKVAQVGMLKAIGASNITVGLAAIAQIVIVNLAGVLIGTLGSLALSLSFPVEIPIIFTGQAVTVTIISLLLIGPISGLVSVWALLRVEPLTALGLAQ